MPWAQVAEQQRGGPSLAAGCVRAFQGVSPSLVADLCAAAGVSPSDAPAALSASQWAALHAAWLAWLKRVQSGEAQSCFMTAASCMSCLTSVVLNVTQHQTGQLCRWHTVRSWTAVQKPCCILFRSCSSRCTCSSETQKQKHQRTCLLVCASR